MNDCDVCGREAKYQINLKEYQRKIFGVSVARSCEMCVELVMKRYGITEIYKSERRLNPDGRKR